MFIAIKATNYYFFCWFFFSHKFQELDSQDDHDNDSEDGAPAKRARKVTREDPGVDSYMTQINLCDLMAGPWVVTTFSFHAGHP